MNIEFKDWEILELDKALGLTKNSKEYLVETDETSINRQALLKYINKCEISFAELQKARILASSFVNSILLQYDSIYAKVKTNNFELGKSNYSEYLIVWNALILAVDRFWDKTKIECYNTKQIEGIELNRKKFLQYLKTSSFQN